MFGTTGLDSPIGKTCPVDVPSLSAQKRQGRVVGYSVYYGTEGDQPRQRKFFVRRSDAEKFIAGRTQSPVPVGELWEKRMEILYNLDRLRSVETTLTDAVSFYLIRPTNRERKTEGPPYMWNRYGTAIAVVRSTTTPCPTENQRHGRDGEGNEWKSILRWFILAFAEINLCRPFFSRVCGRKMHYRTIWHSCSGGWGRRGDTHKKSFPHSTSSADRMFQSDTAMLRHHSTPE